jgi:hypothetical protein
MMKQRKLHSMAPNLLAAALGLGLAQTAFAYNYQNGDFSLNVDTTISYGTSWRVEQQDPNLIGKCNLAPCQGFVTNAAGATVPAIPLSALPNAAQRAAPGRFSSNGDDGNLLYKRGDVFSNALKVTQEIGFTYGENFGGLARWTGFRDFENYDRTDLSDDARKRVAQDVQLLDAFTYYNFSLGEESSGSVRLGRQVVSWGESTFIQNGINVINPVDLSKLRIAGSELKEAFLPIDMIWSSFSFNENLSLEALYMLEFEQTDPEPARTYFSTNDFGTIGGEFVMLGFGTTDEPLDFQACLRGAPIDPRNVGAAAACGTAVLRAPDRTPNGNGQYGAALRYFWPELNNTEFGFFFLNYHSRLPMASGIAVTNGAANSARYFIEYPEDIKLYGMSFNTTLEGSGVALQGELSYRSNQPYQIDDVELLFAALSPLNAVIAQPFNRFISQYGQLAPGQYVQGFARHEVSQYQMTATKLIGPGMLGADQIALVGEIGLTKIWDLPDQSVLRYNGDGTDTGGGPDFTTGNSRNPITQVDGFATPFSWGYRLAARADYNNFVGTPFTVSPRIAFNHDVRGTTPGPGGNFVEGRKSFTFGAEANYLNEWSADLSYTRFYGAGVFNLLGDRDFVSITAKYAF